MVRFNTDQEAQAWRSLVFLLGQLVLSFIVSAGCVWVILAPTNQPTTNAAFALLGTIMGSWLARVAEGNV